MPYVVKPVVDPARPAVPQPEIRAGGLILRCWEPRDAAQLLDAFADPGIQKRRLRDPFAVSVGGSAGRGSHR